MPMNGYMWTGMSKYIFVWNKEKYRGIHMRRLTWIILLEGELVEEGWRKGEGILTNKYVRTCTQKVQDNNKDITFYILWG